MKRWDDGRYPTVPLTPREKRLIAALTKIADTDYRGNRSPESTHAHLALVAEGLRT